MINQAIVFLGRAIREPALHTTAALASVPATSAGMHALRLSTDLDPIELANGLIEPRLWITLGLMAVFGGLGGLVAELLSLHGRIELPHRVKRGSTIRRSHLAEPRYEIDLGIVSRIALGAAAALALLSLYAPTNPTALVVNGLIAGSAATGVFRMVQGRLLARGLAPAARVQRPAAPKTQLSVIRSAETSAVL